MTTSDEDNYLQLTFNCLGSTEQYYIRLTNRISGITKDYGSIPFYT